MKSFTSMLIQKGLPALVLSLCCAGGALGAEYVVKVKMEYSFQRFVSESRSNLTVLDQHPDGRLILTEVGEGERGSAGLSLEEIRNLPGVEYVVPNVRFYAINQPDDPRYSSQWALKKVRAEEAWVRQRGDSNITVAVIDTGISGSHEDLAANMWTNSGETAGNGIDDDGNGFKDDIRGWDFRDNDNDPEDLTSSRNPGHGTHCAGIIGAVGNNGTGISGIAQTIQLMAVRFLGADGSGDLMNGAKAIDYATKNGADIISASWGARVSRTQVTPILEAIQRAEAKGVTFVAAAANDGANNDRTDMYPANAGFDNVITVSASDPSDGKPSWSNYGRARVSIAAPGLDILSTIPGNKYQNLSGTSMATPLVAGAVALILAEARQAGRDLSPLEIRSVLQSTGARVAIETACECRLDVAKALDSISDNHLTVVPNALTLAAGESKQFHGIGGDAPYTFTSSNPAAATIDSQGNLKAVADGSTVLTITDSLGTTAASSNIFIGTTGGGGEECPFGPLCDILCQIDPSFPWCQ